ncbi:MAG: hypothetical protein AB8B74_08575 [Crocinitomicaceae bacterium]
MKTALLSILFLLLSSSLIAQNQQGYMVLVDDTSDGLVYYVSSLFECSFPGDHDGIDAQRIAFDAKFKAHVLDNFEISDFQNFNSSWMEPGRGVNPSQIYSKYLENFPAVYRDAKMIMVQDFSLECKK